MSLPLWSSKCKIMTRFPNILEESYDYAIFFDLGKLVVC